MRKRGSWFDRQMRDQRSLLHRTRWRIYNLAFRVMDPLGLWSPRMSRFFW